MAANPLDLLEALGPKARARIERVTERIALPAGEILFHQGSAPKAVYLVVAGTLGVYVTGPTAQRQLIAIIETGESVGEMAVLSGTPRTATVIAIRDCELLKLTKANFDLLQKREPELMAGIVRILVHRLRQVSRGAGNRIEPRTTAVLPTAHGIATESIARKLGALLEKDGDTVKIIGPNNPKRPVKWYAEQEENHDRVFLCADLGSERWIRQCARQADRILMVARARDPVASALPADLLQQRADHQLLDLVLLHEDGTDRPTRTSRWLDLVPVNRHFHIRESETRDWERLARIVSGRAVGLVLSGGGARAYAHIGATRAILEYGIEIDFIGGVSMGAIIAANLAMGSDIDEVANHVQDAFVHGTPLSDITLPLIALVKGRKVERLLAEHFDSVEIPDLWLPFYCVSSNLSDGSLHIHKRGLVRDALRASVALPGVLPPKIVNRRVLVDGAVLDNLPVDVMRSLHRGPIVAVDVTRDRALTPEMLAIEHRSSWLQQLIRPPIISILMRAGTVSSDSDIEKQAQNADLLIEPPLGDIDIRDWKAFDQAVTIGYEHTAEQLDRSLGSLRRVRRKPQI